MAGDHMTQVMQVILKETTLTEFSLEPLSLKCAQHHFHTL